MGRCIEIACPTQNLKQIAKNATIIWENCGNRGQKTKCRGRFYKFSIDYIQKCSRAHIALMS